MKKILILLLLFISIPLVKAEETEDLAPNAKSINWRNTISKK